MSTKGRRRYGEAAGRSVESAMRRRKKGTLRRSKGGRGGRVRSRAQAIAIGLSEAREKGAKVPAKKGARRTGGAKKGARRTGGAKKGARRAAKKGGRSRARSR